ncbi:hypothetical protein ANCCAN_20193 [Ancylostoma caninum]|uniref:ATPase AAA-type core domain-containing protein n=1 Tax=Ancylostoma caninum TaxID=29170 RepID=A0A368FR50_ANCCA|nr:hypothetical protein ANCCAN_20193 [Ancylostoma caninum]
MDIRSFFGGKKAAAQGEPSGSSTLSAARKAALSSPTSEPKKRSSKIDASATEKKGKSSKKTAIPVVDLGDDDDSEGESPIPSSVRKAGKDQKRSWRPLISDSDEDDAPPSKSKNRVKSVTPSPVKSPPKTKRSRVVVYDSDEDQSPAKKQNKVETPVHDSGDDEVTSETDSENEFVEKKVKKKKDSLPAGQKKLVFESGPKKPTSKEKKSSEKLQRVSAAEFFEDNDVAGKSTSAQKKEENKEEIKKAKISPKQGKSDNKASKTDQNKDNLKKKQEELKDTPSKDKFKPQKGKAPLQDHDKPKASVAPLTEAVKPVRGDVYVPWVDKYKPKTASQLVGQHGDKSPLNKLLGWLKDWGRNNLGEGGRIKKPKPPPFLAQSDGAPFKAVLLSGSPGIGKTTCAVMACESLGWKTVEMNASDVRNKKSLEQQVNCSCLRLFDLIAYHYERPSHLVFVRTQNYLFSS